MCESHAAVVVVVVVVVRGHQKRAAPNSSFCVGPFRLCVCVCLRLCMGRVVVVVAPLDYWRQPRADRG